MTRQFSRPLLVLMAGALVFVVLLWIESLLPSSVVRGRHMPAARGNYIFIDFGEASETRVQAVFHHETVHDLTRRGILDVDIPTAAALEYYWEWDATGTLEDSSRVHAFEAGLESTDAAVDISELLARYVDSSDLEQLVVVEDRQSYDDGALLAGLTYQQFQGDRGFRYLLLLASSCGHELARDAVLDGGLADLILEFRAATTTFVDIVPNEALRQALGELDDVSRMEAERYLGGLAETHGFHLMKDGPTLIGAMP